MRVIAASQADRGRLENAAEVALRRGGGRRWGGLMVALVALWSLFPKPDIQSTGAWLVILATSAVRLPGNEGIASSRAAMDLPSVAAAFWWPVIAAALAWQCTDVVRRARQALRRDAARRITFEGRPAPGH